MYQTESIRFLEKNDIHTKKYIKSTFDPATVIWHFICDFMQYQEPRRTGGRERVGLGRPGREVHMQVYMYKFVVWLFWKFVSKFIFIHVDLHVDFPAWAAQADSFPAARTPRLLILNGSGPINAGSRALTGLSPSPKVGLRAFQKHGPQTRPGPGLSPDPSLLYVIYMYVVDLLMWYARDYADGTKNFTLVFF